MKIEINEKIARIKIISKILPLKNIRETIRKGDALHLYV